MGKLLNKYRNVPKTVKASFWFLVCSFVQKGITTLTTPIFTRLLSTSEYGDFGVYQTWYNIIIILASLNLASGVYMRGLVKYEEDRDRFSGSLQLLYILVTFLVFGIYLLFQKPLDILFGLPSEYIYVMFVDILLATAFHFFSTRQRVDYDYRLLLVVTVINALLRPSLGIIAIKLFPEHRLSARIYSMIIADLITYGPIFISFFTKGIHVFSVKYWKYALAFNIPLVPHYLSQIVLNQSDRIMIKKMIGSDEAGIYSLAYGLASLMTILNSSIINTLTPWLYKQMKKENYKEIGINSTLIMVLVASANFFLVVFAPEIIAIMAPGTYYEAIWVIPPVSVGTFFIFMYSVFSRFEFYFEKTRFMMLASVFGAVLNVVLNYIFIPKYGYYAAGYTTLFCYLCYTLGHFTIMSIIMKKKKPGVKIFDIKLLSMIVLIFVGLCMLTMAVYTMPILRIIIFLAVLFVFYLKKDVFLNMYREIESAKKVKNKTSEIE